MALDRFCFRVLLENSLAVVFSTCIIVVGCGCPIYIIVVRSRNSSREFINDAPISASDADDMTFVMILHILWMGPLSGGYSL